MTTKCAKIDALLDNLLEGQLGSEHLREVYGHLSECEDCLQHFVALQWVLSTLRRDRYYFRQTQLWNRV